MGARPCKATYWRRNAQVTALYLLKKFTEKRPFQNSSHKALYIPINSTYIL
jgi:hypothetical protein